MVWELGKDLNSIQHCDFHLFVLMVSLEREFLVAFSSSSIFMLFFFSFFFLPNTVCGRNCVVGGSPTPHGRKVIIFHIFMKSETIL